MADRQGFYFQGEDKILEWLAKVEQKSKDNTKLYSELGDILLDGVHDRFRRGVAPDGRPWQKSWRAIAQSSWRHTPFRKSGCRDKNITFCSWRHTPFRKK